MFGVICLKNNSNDSVGLKKNAGPFTMTYLLTADPLKPFDQNLKQPTMQ